MRLEDIVWGVDPPVREDDPLVFTIDSIPVPEGEIVSDSLVLTKGLSDYGDSCRLDVVHFFAPKHTCRQLGMLIMAGIFCSRRPELSVKLADERAELTNMSFGWDPFDRQETFRVGYMSQPLSFGYYPQVPASRHPLHDDRLHEWERPSAVITNEHGTCVNDEQHANRSVLSGFGGPEGAARFAELLLNIGLPDTTLDEFHLEGYPGYRSVSSRSAEIALWLPGSFRWPVVMG